jgi:hypothetical protein
MSIFAGLDVSDKTTHICVVDAERVVLKRDAAATDPDVLAKWLGCAQDQGADGDIAQRQGEPAARHVEAVWAGHGHGHDPGQKAWAAGRAVHPEARRQTGRPRLLCRWPKQQAHSVGYIETSTHIRLTAIMKQRQQRFHSCPLTSKTNIGDRAKVIKKLKKCKYQLHNSI